MKGIGGDESLATLTFTMTPAAIIGLLKGRRYSP
jgi:hypothetical protein